MRLTKTLAAAAVVAMAGTTVSAGGPSPVAPITPVTIVSPAPTGSPSSVPAGYIVLGLVAALVAASGSF